MIKRLDSEYFAVECDDLFEILRLSANNYASQRPRRGSERREPKPNLESLLLESMGASTIASAGTYYPGCQIYLVTICS